MLINQVIIPKNFRGTDYSGKQKVLAVNKETGFMIVWYSGGSYWAGLGTTKYSKANICVYQLAENGSIRTNIFANDRSIRTGIYNLGHGKDINVQGQRLSKDLLKSLKPVLAEYGIDASELDSKKTKLYGSYDQASVINGVDNYSELDGLVVDKIIEETRAYLKSKAPKTLDVSSVSESVSKTMTNQNKATLAEVTNATLEAIQAATGLKVRIDKTIVNNYELKLELLSPVGDAILGQTSVAQNLRGKFNIGGFNTGCFMPNNSDQSLNILLSPIFKALEAQYNQLG